jgi:polyisoprenoid-binding protein YceI
VSGKTPAAIQNQHKETTMKRFLFLPAAIALALGLAVTAPAALKAPAGVFDIDASHSKVGFEVPHLVISTVEGQFTKFEGKINIGDDFAKSSVKVTVDLASVDTGVAKRDEHLRDGDFFDVKKTPKMTFESTQVTGVPEGFKLTGNLTIKNVTKPVTFDAQYLGAVNDGFGNDRVAFKAKAKINRKDFGLTYGAMIEAGPVIGDDVTIDLKVEATKPLTKS